MAQKGSVSLGKLYRRGKTGIWYFKITDSSGKRCQKSTGTKVKRDAAEFQERYLRMVGRNRSLYAKSVTLRQEVSKYLDIETNPRRKEAKVAETNYTDGHALNTARYSRYIIEWADKRLPGLLDTDISEISRRDVKDLASAIVAERGNCRTSQQVFANLKTILKQAASDDIILASPGTDVANVGYTEKHRSAIPEDMLSWMIGQKHLFPSLEFWAYMAVVTATGMRRGEAIAISSSRMEGHMLTIDQQIMANSQTLSKPKGGLSRTIPLPKIAMAALKEIGPGDKGFYFPLSRNWVTSQLGLLKAALKAADGEHRATWQMMTPHTLRRSANTNLLIHGISPSLIAEYLSWRHQRQDIDPLIPMQRRYFDLVSTNLQPVADALDVLYGGYQSMEKVLPFKA